jgi:hypothetical protein
MIQYRNQTIIFVETWQSSSGLLDENKFSHSYLKRKFEVGGKFGDYQALLFGDRKVRLSMP